MSLICVEAIFWSKPEVFWALQTCLCSRVCGWKKKISPHSEWSLNWRVFIETVHRTHHQKEKKTQQDNHVVKRDHGFMTVHCFVFSQWWLYTWPACPMKCLQCMKLPAAECHLLLVLCRMGRWMPRSFRGAWRSLVSLAATLVGSPPLRGCVYALVAALSFNAHHTNSKKKTKHLFTSSILHLF